MLKSCAKHRRSRWERERERERCNKKQSFLCYLRRNSIFSLVLCDICAQFIVSFDCSRLPGSFFRTLASSSSIVASSSSPNFQLDASKPTNSRHFSIMPFYYRNRFCTFVAMRYNGTEEKKNTLKIDVAEAIVLKTRYTDLYYLLSTVLLNTYIFNFK